MAERKKAGRKRAPQITIRQIAAMDAPEIRLLRAQLAGFDVVETPVPGTTRESFRRIESVFDFAKRKGWIAPHQHRAAEILEANFAKSGLMPRVTMSWSSFVDGSGWNDGTEARGRHQKEFRAAIAAIPDQYRDSFLTWFLDAQGGDVTIYTLGALFTKLKHKEAQKGLGIHVLTSALNSLSWHYGVTNEKKRNRNAKSC